MKRLAAIGLAVCALAVAQHPPESQQPGAAQSGHAEGDQNDLTMWKWANFAILAGGLGFLITKNAGPFFQGRTAEIRRGIDEAQKLKADAEARAAEVDARLANLGAEIEAMRVKAGEEAAAERERIREEMRRELSKIQDQGDQEIRSAVKAAQLDLKRHAAGVALEIARQKVRQRITPADQDVLVEGFVAEIRQEGRRLSSGR